MTGLGLSLAGLFSLVLLSRVMRRTHMRIVKILALPVYGLLLVWAWLVRWLRPGNRDGLP